MRAFDAIITPFRLSHMYMHTSFVHIYVTMTFPESHTCSHFTEFSTRGFPKPAYHPPVFSYSMTRSGHALAFNPRRHSCASIPRTKYSCISIPGIRRGFRPLFDYMHLITATLHPRMWFLDRARLTESCTTDSLQLSDAVPKASTSVQNIFQWPNRWGKVRFSGCGYWPVSTLKTSWTASLFPGLVQA